MFRIHEHVNLTKDDKSERFVNWKGVVLKKRVSENIHLLKSGGEVPAGVSLAEKVDEGLSHEKRRRSRRGGCVERPLEET